MAFKYNGQSYNYKVQILVLVHPKVWNGLSVPLPNLGVVCFCPFCWFTGFYDAWKQVWVYLNFVDFCNFWVWGTEPNLQRMCLVKISFHCLNISVILNNIVIAIVNFSMLYMLYVRGELCLMIKILSSFQNLCFLNPPHIWNSLACRLLSAS